MHRIHVYMSDLANVKIGILKTETVTYQYSVQMHLLLGIHTTIHYLKEKSKTLLQVLSIIIESYSIVYHKKMHGQLQITLCL